MQCDICFRTGGYRLPFLCPTDARNQLYEHRIEQTRVLLDRDSLNKDIATIVSQTKESKSSGLIPTDVSSRWNVDRRRAEEGQAVNRTEQIIAHADDLRKKVEAARADIARRKAVIARRKSELASAKNGLDERRTRQVEEMEKKIRVTNFRWNQKYTMTAESRAFLCGEAARLYGLARFKENGTWLDEYRIAGNKIMDLRTMNSFSAAHITTCLSNITHLLILATHYLALRLPAEITLPHRDYPLPTILSLAASYQYTNLPFPGNTPSHSSSNSPSASRHAEASIVPRPRPLFITKPLPMLAKEDPSAHALFMEGVTLLAYDIVWVCKTQGIPVGPTNSAATSFEDMCALGRNLFNLLIGTNPRPSPPSRGSSTQSTPTKSQSKAKIAADGSEGGSEEKKNGLVDMVTIGHFSHGTTHTQLNSPAGQDLIRSFKLISPLKLADLLKSHLLSEVASAEWEVLAPEAWNSDLGDEGEGDGVMVGARNDAQSAGGILGRVSAGGWDGGIAQSFMSMRTVMDAVELVGGAAQGDRKPGTSGWTKLKPR